MGWFDDRYEREEIRLLQELVDLGQQQVKILRKIANELEPKLTFIKIAIGGEMPVGPVTLNIGDKKTATVLGFDQNGAPFAIDFTANPVTWTNDNVTAVQDAPQPDGSDQLTAMAAGVSNLTAAVAGFTDTETVTVVAAAPVLSSIKVSID